MLRSLLIASSAAALALPAAAGASTIDATPPTGFAAITFLAGPGDSDLTLASGNNWTDAAQTLTGTGGCTGSPVVHCPNGNATITFRGGNDRFTNAFYFYDLSIDGKGGNDTIVANGAHTTATGGAGDDTIDISANGSPTGSGGAGNDQLRGGYPSNAATTLSGEGDDDLVVGNSNNDTLTGGNGADQLFSAHGNAGTADGGAGDDVIVNLATATIPGTFAETGSGGDDTIVGGRWTDIVKAGNDDDVIDVSGDAATATDKVSCGRGVDTVYADAGDVIGDDCETILPGPAPDLPVVDAALAHLAAAFPTTPTAP
jgi:Ca2+-binding RTX toxin-like protein